MAKFRGAVKTCAHCGGTFKVPPSRAETARYCSHRCAAYHGYDGKGTRVTLACRHCGQPFTAPRSQADRRKYCSVRCRNSAPAYLHERADRIAGANNPQWNGGVTMHSGGYVYRYAPHHPYGGRQGYVFEHRLAMEQHLRDHDPGSPFLILLGEQRYLSPAYVVHHRDGNRVNNAVDNLECLTNSEHITLHNAMRR